MISDPKPEKLQASCLNLNSPSAEDYKFAHSSNLVDLRLFDQVLKQSPKDQNIIFSSLSVISVLSMVLLGKKYALKKYDHFALNTSCFWGSTGSNLTPVVQFHEFFVTNIMNKVIYYYC